MRGPYQIRRERVHQEEGCWRYTLWRFDGGKAVKRVVEGEYKGATPPMWMMKVQARLNSKFVLDEIT